MKTLYKIIIAVAILAAAGIAIWWKLSPKPEKFALYPATIKEIQQVVELSSMEIYEELPVKATIGSRHLVARETIEGSISYDLQKLKIEEKGDTIQITLPEETIEIRESTKPDSYIIIDNWNDHIFGSGNFTTAEENAIKRRVITQAKENLKSKGYIKKAREEAKSNISTLLQPITTRPLKIQ